MPHTIDDDAARVLALGHDDGAPPFEAGTPDAARAAYNAGFLLLQGEKEVVQSVEDRQIDGPGGAITVRIYRGIDAPSDGGAGLLYCHGGGWVIGNLSSHDEICRWFANIGQCTVVCPDYRLAPEHPFPAGLEDCVASLEFMERAAVELRIDPGRIAVSGDSAGGNLAAVIALLSRDGAAPALAAQLLIYPNTDAAQTADSYRRFSSGYGLTADTMRWFRNHYVDGAAEIEHWKVSPLRAESLASAAPAFVAIAGCDILADEGTAYAQRLSDDGVPLVVRHWPGQIHGFVSMGRYIPAAREAVVAAVAAWRGFEARLSR